MSIVRVGLLVSTALFLGSACQVPKAVDAAVNMEGKMDGMDKKMGKTYEAIRLQELATALDKTINDKTYLPSQAVPGATIFNDVATADEIVKVVFATMRNIEGIENGTYAPGYPSYQRDALMKDLEDQSRQHKKLKKSWYNGLLALSYTIPAAKLAEIVEMQITREGQFEETAYQILALRGQMAAISMSSYKPVNAAGIDRISDELEKIRDITKYSFRAKIKVQVSVSEDENIAGFDLDQGSVGAVKEAKEKIAKLEPRDTAAWGKAIARFQAIVDSFGIAK